MPGGLTAVQAATELAFSTIGAGIRELQGDARDGDEGIDGGRPAGRGRRPGAGRKLLTQSDPGFAAALESLISPTTRGDPESPLRWTTKSLRSLADALTQMGHTVSFKTVGNVLRSMNYSLLGNAKVLEGTNHPDRDAQFGHSAAQVQARHDQGEPAISVDTKKKALVGEFKNTGHRYVPAGQLAPVIRSTTGSKAAWSTR